MSLWVDKYRPNNLGKMDFQKTQAMHLKNLVQHEDFPHLLFYGPSGVGKKTRIMALLRKLYGPGVERLRMEHTNFLTPSNKKVEVMTVASNYHIEVNASDAGIYDRIVVMELIKNAAQTHQLDANGQREFKVILLTEVDKLTKDAQQALRRTMEKYIATCRLILCANSISQVIPAIRSRCLGIRVASPSDSEIVQILQNICKKEGLSIPLELAQRIAANCEGNLRRAILTCEACKINQYPFDKNQKIVEPDWENYIDETANIILKEQTPQNLLNVRTRLYELLCHGIPTEIIFKRLIKQLLKNCDMTVKKEVIEVAADFEHRLHRGSKTIFHLEAFIAKFMSIYLQFMEDSMANIL